MTIGRVANLSKAAQAQLGVGVRVVSIATNVHWAVLMELILVRNHLRYRLV
jgi:hypothetical protein